MQDFHYFTVLKTAVLRKFCEANPHWQRPLSEFGVREIARFQELMQAQAGGRISEKWFYTHLKKDQAKLPRADVLDLLSRFAGYTCWAGFKNEQAPLAIDDQSGSQLRHFDRRTGRIAAILATGLLALFALAAALASWWPPALKAYEVCFTDALTQEPLSGVGIRLEQWGSGESPLVVMAGPSGCHTFRTAADEVVFKVEAAYYRPDTITRRLESEYFKENIPLRRDDYAWMIHVFSNGKMADLKKHREQLDRMIAPDAVVLQVDASTGAGVELYNKSEFITKMTMPVSGLKNLKVLETLYDGSGRIQKLRFTQL